MNFQSWAVSACLSLLLSISIPVFASPFHPNTGFLTNGEIGLFQHLRPQHGWTPQRANKLVQDIGASYIAGQAKYVGADWYIITLTQSEFMNAPNKTYDQLVGSGEYTPKRDLILDLHTELKKRGIKLGVYIPLDANAHNKRNIHAKKLGWDTKNNRPTPSFRARWSSVLKEFSDRYKGKVKLYWLDHGGQNKGFPNLHNDSSYHQAFYDALTQPGTVIAQNPGANFAFNQYKVFPQFMDYLAGHGPGAQVPPSASPLPTGRWYHSVQWHTLNFLGTRWGGSDVRASPLEWGIYLREINQRGGALTLDVGIQGKHYGMNNQQLEFVKKIVNISKRVPEEFVVYADEASKANKAKTFSGWGAGYFSKGAWLEYDGINLSTGYNRFSIRYASPKSGSFELRRDKPTGKLLGTIQFNSTGSWNFDKNSRWAHIDLSAFATQGRNRKIYLVAKNNPVNLQRFTFSNRY